MKKGDSFKLTFALANNLKLNKFRVKYSTITISSFLWFAEIKIMNQLSCNNCGSNHINLLRETMGIIFCQCQSCGKFLSYQAQSINFKDVPGRTWGFRFLFMFFICLIPILMLFSLEMPAYGDSSGVIGLLGSPFFFIPALNLYPEKNC